MKKTIRRIVVLVAFICVTLINHANAQTDVRILDLSITPLLKVQDSLVQDSVEMLVQFKINKPSDAAKVHFWLGTEKDSSDILSIMPEFNTTGNISNLSYNGQSNKVKNYQAIFVIKISKAYYINSSKATLFVETNAGQFTTRLYF